LSRQQSACLIYIKAAKGGRQKTTFRLHMFVVSVINDPRFELMLYTPADRDTDDYCLKLMVKTKLKAK